MNVTYFRARRPGPEAAIENAVARNIPELFPSGSLPSWTAGSIPIGAGLPDLVVMTYEPEVVALANSDMPTAKILGYLRAVGCAKLDAITGSIRQSRETIIRCLDSLIEAQAVSNGPRSFSVSPTWRRILPEIVTIEAKTLNWQKAVAQAGRNRIFAHRSFVALPQRVAERVREEAVFRDLEIGLLSVRDGNQVEILRSVRPRQPRVWSYYYQLAVVVAKHFGKGNHAVRCAAGSGSS